MESKTVNISIMQMSSVVGDIDSNIDKVSNLVLNFLPSNTDILILPEVWTVGWSCSKFKDSAQNISNSSVLSFLSNLAKKYNINIIGGSFISKNGEKYFNTCPVIGRKGNLLALYNKNHLYSYYGCNEGDIITPGDYPVIVNIEGIKYGLSICYDIRFPELYRAYRSAGADILINCAAWGSNKPIPWEVMTKSRAVENQCYMVALTQSGYIENNEYNLGQSRIIDYKGEEVVSIMSGEKIISANLLLDEMYTFREKCTILNDIKSSYEVKLS